MTGSSDAFARFRSDLDAAVTRGRRAAAAAGATNAAQRDRNRESTERAKAGQPKPDRHRATSEDVRRVATGFRAHRGLPVDEPPAGAQSSASAEESQKRTDAKANTAPPPPVLGSRPVAGPRGQLPLKGDDDEDFSQARILY